LGEAEFDKSVFYNGLALEMSKILKDKGDSRDLATLVYTGCLLHQALCGRTSGSESSKLYTDLVTILEGAASTNDIAKCRLSYILIKQLCKEIESLSVQDPSRPMIELNRFMAALQRATDLINEVGTSPGVRAFLNIMISYGQAHIFQYCGLYDIANEWTDKCLVQIEAIDAGHYCSSTTCTIGGIAQLHLKQGAYDRLKADINVLQKIAKYYPIAQVTIKQILDQTRFGIMSQDMTRKIEPIQADPQVEVVSSPEIEEIPPQHGALNDNNSIALLDNNDNFVTLSNTIPQSFSIASDDVDVTPVEGKLDNDIPTLDFLNFDDNMDPLFEELYQSPVLLENKIEY